MTSVAEVSFANRFTETEKDLKRAEAAFNALISKNTEYARQLASLCCIYRKVLGIYRQALAEEQEYLERCKPIAQNQ